MRLINPQNCSEFSTGTLLRAYSVIESLDGERYAANLDTQAAISSTLELNGWIYDEDNHEWWCPVNEEGSND
jgi:hypothetical protein